MQVKPNSSVDSVASVAKVANENSATQRLIFFKRLQTLTNKIHASNTVDQIVSDLLTDICDLFDCDRLTIYMVAPDGGNLISKVKKDSTHSKIYACRFPTRVSLDMSR